MSKRIRRRASDRDQRRTLSSALGHAGGAILLTLSVAAAAAVSLAPDQRAWYRARLHVPGADAMSPVAPMPDSLGEAIVAWNRLRQSDGLTFPEYAGFLLAHPGWPAEDALRKTAERAILPDMQPPPLVIAYFTRFPPLTTAGNLRYAEALFAMGRPAEAQAAARLAWIGGALSSDDETRLLARFASSIPLGDHDVRMEKLLWSRATAAAVRQLPFTSAARRPLYQARIAMQLGQPTAATYVLGLGDAANRDAGFVNDRARWLRDSGQWPSARDYLARPRILDAPPFAPEAWFETLLSLAKGAATDGQWATAYGIASQVGDAYPPGVFVRDRPIGERDDYTSLVWLAGQAAMKLSRPYDAMRMFQLYATAAKSPQTQAKGYYWSGRAAATAGRSGDSQALWQQAATHYDQFYGQLAAERIGMPLPAPVVPAPPQIDPATAAAFDNREVVRAARLLGDLGDWQDQTLFLRAIAAQANSDSDRVMVGRLAESLRRPDLGVIMARRARSDGSDDYIRSGFPVLPLSSFHDTQWTMIHAISRQESQFDRQAVSRTNARGLMQLMPRTAAEQAGKLGMGYDYQRLTDDPTYNVMLGSQYFQRMRDYYGGSYLLAVAAYNAGPGNVNRWITANGDPRLPTTDVIDWIEAIPLSETRGYVQRVLENAVVYDLLNPDRARMPTSNRLSAYLGKNRPG